MAAMEKNNKNLNVPNLRFPEFSGEWERCKVKDFTKVVAGATPSTSNKEYWGGDIRWMNSGELNLKRVYEVQGRITQLGYEKTSTKIIPPQSVLIGLAGQGKTRGTAAINYVELCTNQSIASILPSDKYYPEFLYQNIESRYKELRDISSGDGGRGGLNLQMIYNLNIPYCSISEQRKIGDFLCLLDQRIETQRKIIEDLKKLKDAICNLNFTSGSVLELRNAGKFVRGLTYSASDVIDYTIGTAVMRSNNISNGDPVNFEELVWVNKTPNHEQILRSGDIVICMANGSFPLVGKASYYVDCGIESATVGAFCGIYRSDNPLTKWLFQSKHYKKHIQRCIQGGNGASANIYPEDILAISFNIPCGYERVLNILNSLEEKYLLEQKLLSRYLGVKSYLLSRLFI